MKEELQDLPGKLRVLVTGADGMLGTNIVHELVSRGHAVSCFIEKGHDGDILKGMPVEIIRGDIGNEADVDNAISGVSYIIHTAGVTAMWPARMDLSWRINFEAVKLLVKLSKKHNIKRFIHIGTATSFGHGPIENPGTEHSAYTNHVFKLDYQDTKHAAQEYLLKEFRENSFPVIVLNPTFMIGKYDNGNGSNKMVLFIYKGKVPGFSPGGKNYVNVKDVATAAANALNMGQEGECYITGGRNLSYRQSFGLIAETLGVKAPSLKMPKLLSYGFGALQSSIAAISGKPPAVSYRMARIGCEHCYYSPQKAIEELKMPQTPIEDGIRDSIEWFREKGMTE